MARLNEPPPMSIDSSDILRKKLLRQNRELARANTNLAQKIRILEQEKQQLISQKLEIASRLLELEQQIERNAAQRIADHALNVRARLEAQLRECMMLLEDIGQEPPRKRRQAASPGSARAAKARSPPRKRPAETAKDAEVRAALEGRLPPLYETKPYPYPRQTLNPDQIMALCSEAADTTDSPELGPPPMSRFAESHADTMKLPSPSKSPSPPCPLPSPARSRPVPLVSSSSPKKSATKSGNMVASGANPMRVSDIFKPLKEEIHHPKVPEALRSSSKRKFSASDSQDVNSKPKACDASKPRITVSVRGDRKNKTLKELASIQREAREDLAPLEEPRKVLAAKSTNEDMNTPRKVSKPPSEVGSQKPLQPKDASRKDKPRTRAKEPEKATVVALAPAPTSPKPMEDIVLCKAIATSTEAVPLSPSSPQPTPFSLQPHDTPPPADISAHGETARPSRRARSAVSYTEPNLRDKMRRPTKELFDAVAGEGRYKPRSSTSKAEEPPSVDTISAKQLSSTTDDGKSLGSTIPTSSEALEKPGTCSPLAQRTTTKTDRTKKAFLVPSKDGEEVHDVGQASLSSQIAASNAFSETTETLDPYDFASSLSGAAGEKLKHPSRRQSKSSRRLSSVARDDFQSEDDAANLKPKSAANRKRASIAHTRIEVSSMDDETPDTSGSTEGEVVSRPTARRRSMMV